MAHEFLPYSAEQPYLFPPSPRDWLPEDHIVYQIIDVVEELDKSVFFTSYGRDGRGARALSPVMMVSLLLYAWVRRVYSSRKIAALCRDDVGGRVISSGYQPDFRTINTFRLRHKEALNDLFKQSIGLCRRAGMIGMVQMALDGSKIASNASKRKAMSYARMVEAEERLQSEIDLFFERGAQEDVAEDAEFGADHEDLSIPDELRRRENRIAKIRAAKIALEAEALAQAEAKRKSHAAKVAQAQASGKSAKGWLRPTIDPAPKDSAQRSFTDPESRIMKSASGAYMQAYNAQAVVDSKCQVIVACELSQQAADVVHLPEMLDQMITNLGGIEPNTLTLLADGGYFSEANMKAADEREVTALMPPDRERCGSPSEPSAEPSSEELAQMTPVEQMRVRVSTKAGRDAYKKRKTIVEPVFGQMKGCAGHPGFSGFLRRGMERCSAEWQWICASHNIGKYIGFKLGKPDELAPRHKPATAAGKVSRLASAQGKLALAYA